MATYSVNNFLGTPVLGDVTIKIYDKTKKLRYEFNPNIAYFFTNSNIVIIRIEDKNDILLDFTTLLEAATATSKLNDVKKELTTNIYENSIGSLSEKEQRKLSYFHALSKSMTIDSQKITESKYKSSHNVKVMDLWGSNIPPCLTYSDAVNQSISNSAVTLHSEVILTIIPESNGQSWYFLNNNRFVRPWIGPQDITFPLTNLPSSGFELRLFRGDDATTGTPGSEIDPSSGAWSVEYYNGIVHFGLGNTPKDLGWGTIKATFFEYTGVFGVNGVTNVYTSVIFNSGTSMLIFNSGDTNETIIDLNPLKSTVISINNSNMDVLSTNYLSPLACDIPLTSVNVNNSRVCVFVNGIQVSTGNLDTDCCYFSNDGGITKKISGTETLNDLLYWNYDTLNNPVAGYELVQGVDKITFMYLNI